MILPNLPVHIVHRANNRAQCFFEDNDFLVYLSLLKQAAKKAQCEVHAYCLMSNHVHLLLTPSSPKSCGGLMHDLAQPYTRYFNKKYGRTGGLWEGRFRSCVVESAGYILACYRYIELNPVRAGMVDRPWLYTWSSCLPNIGLRSDSFVQPHAELVSIGSAAYRSLLNETIHMELLRSIRESTAGGYPLVSEAFGAKLGDMEHRVRRGKPGRPPEGKTEGKTDKSVPGTDLFSEDAAS